jgi:hypothetical protein
MSARPPLTGDVRVAGESGTVIVRGARRLDRDPDAGSGLFRVRIEAKDRPPALGAGYQPCAAWPSLCSSGRRVPGGGGDRLLAM